MTKILNLGLAVVGISLATFASSGMMNANGTVYESPCTDGGSYACTIMDIGNGQFKVLRWGTLMPPIKFDPWIDRPIDIYVPIKKGDLHLDHAVGGEEGLIYVR